MSAAGGTGGVAGGAPIKSAPDGIGFDGGVSAGGRAFNRMRGAPPESAAGSAADGLAVVAGGGGATGGIVGAVGGMVAAAGGVTSGVTGVAEGAGAAVCSVVSRGLNRILGAPSLGAAAGGGVAASG